MAKPARAQPGPAAARDGGAARNAKGTAKGASGAGSATRNAGGTAKNASGAGSGRNAGNRATARSGSAARRPPGAGGPTRGQGRPRRDLTPPPAPPAAAGPPAWLRWSTFALAILGLAASAYLTYTHYSDSALAGCTETSGAVNCTKVTTSPQSVVFGIPVAVLGLAFYVFLVAIMSPYAWRSGRREVALARMASLVVGLGFVLYLIYAELYQIGAICLYCTSVHVITFLLFVLTGLAAAIWGLGPRGATS